MTTVTRTVKFRPGRGRRRPRSEETATAPGRVPRAARLMALAIKFDGMLRDGVVSNQSELAELAQVTQPRMTQIMNLLHLAPDIQEELLHLIPGVTARYAVTESDVRLLSAETRWDRQRSVWRLLTGCRHLMPSMDPLRRGMGNTAQRSRERRETEVPCRRRGQVPLRFVGSPQAEF